MGLEELIIQVGFPAAIVVYLLYERAAMTQKLIDKIDQLISINTIQMKEISNNINEMCSTIKIMLLEREDKNK